jgi:hypothetical protein
MRSPQSGGPAPAEASRSGLDRSTQGSCLERVEMVYVLPNAMRLGEVLSWG